MKANLTQSSMVDCDLSNTKIETNLESFHASTHVLINYIIHQVGKLMQRMLASSDLALHQSRDPRHKSSTGDATAETTHSLPQRLLAATETHNGKSTRWLANIFASSCVVRRSFPKTLTRLFECCCLFVA